MGWYVDMGADADRGWMRLWRCWWGKLIEREIISIGNILVLVLLSLRIIRRFISILLMCFGMNLSISISIFSSLNAICAVGLFLEELQSLYSSIHTASLVALFNPELFSCYSSLIPQDNLCRFFATLNSRHQF